MNGDEASEKAAKLINDLQDISFVKIALIVLGTWAIIVFVRRTFPLLAHNGPSQLRLYVLGAVPLIRLFLLFGAIVWIIPIVFNVTFQNFLVIAGAASVAIGFAFKDYVSSLIAGVVAIFEKPYRPGDWVKVGEDYGEVQNVGLRAITLRTPSDDIVTAPHIRLWQENIVNGNDGARTLMCVADFWVAPDHDARALRAALRDVAMTSAYLDYDNPVVVILSETPCGTHYRLKAYPFDMRDQFVFVSDLTVRGKAAIARAGGRQVVVPAAAERPKTSPPDH
ncbi:mechanosensitive ion channel domain-containing protein [uncultured Jannaschia sp.]|uniref:mechanosensitive ion channel family protein n=1 Tax=uncultured Jannaschia sp. TaxID=293347 RepID=UPI0026060656|nr:mechanosensitive ion channel domain-containing protein [uncultured Jannaschia sp.]